MSDLSTHTPVSPAPFAVAQIPNAAEQASASEPERYQLCRMLLVNVGTNMHVPSSRITAIDPRNGAAVLGDNGVGKTTTLRLFPLFFGHLASQIVATGQGQEAMIRFVLPNDACAIVFEYQRGSSDEKDMRFVVMRRRADDPDVPFYRMYKGGFKKELFIDEGRFLTDEETQVRASALGLQTTSKLTPSEYRCVILRTPSKTKDGDRLRRYALEWSFGPHSLENLDRVVAAMIKKQVNFADIVQVVIGLVQHEIGHGSEGSRLVFKQGRAAIDRWLRNREACAEAIRQEPVVASLDGALKDHRALEAMLRSYRSDVNALRVIREAEFAAARSEIAALQDENTRALEAEQLRRTELANVAAVLAASYQQANAAFEQERGMAHHFESQGAESWSRLVAELPALRERFQGLHTQIQAQLQAADASQAEISRQYDQLKANATSVAQERKVALTQSKGPILDTKQKSLDQIADAQAQAQAQADEEVAAQRREIDESIEPLQSQTGELRSAMARPAASPQAHARVDAAIERLQVKQEEIAKARETHAGASIEMDKATRTLDDAQRQLRVAKDQQQDASTALERAKARLNPTSGTLLSALRSSGDQQWRRDLAKVIRPELLERQDLEPQAIEDTARTLYGWQLNTGVLPTPSWADADMSAREVEEAQARLSGAESVVAERTADLERVSAARKQAEENLNLATAGLTVLKQQEVELKNQRDAAQQQLEREQRDARSTAEAALQKVTSSIDALKRQRQSLDSQAASSKASIKAAHDRQRDQARALCDQDCKAIDDQLAKLDTDLKSDLRELDSQANDLLRKGGVDTARLDELKAEKGVTQQAIQEREAHEGLVHAWKGWMEAGGYPKMESLRSAAQSAGEASRDATAKVNAHDTQVKERAGAHDAKLAAIQKQAQHAEGEVQALVEADESFGDYMAMGQSVIDRDTSASDLVARVHQTRKDLNRKEEAIRVKAVKLRRDLTARESAVAEFVEASLSQVQAASPIMQAGELISCYRQLGVQVVTDVNLTLKTILSNIGAFHKSIRMFEREVGGFNRKLQEGLSEVKCFERVQNLRLDVVTNFEGLGFYKKLSKMDDVIRAQAAEVGKDYTKDLPSEDTARALGDFMSVMGNDGNVEVNLAACITLSGSVSDNGQHKSFRRASELQNVSSEGLTSLIFITLMTALLNTIRGADPVHVPWVTDEVGKFDSKNFQALMHRLLDNRIDVVTASPELGPAQQALFAHRYLFEDKGRIREFREFRQSAQAHAGEQSNETGVVA